LTQIQLTCQIATITGEPLSACNRLGFSVIPEQPDGLEPEDVELVLNCPFCGHQVLYPARARDGSETLAECDAREVYFGFDPDEVYTIGADQSNDVAPEGRQPRW
jgi:hypothetical protein